MEPIVDAIVRIVCFGYAFLVIGLILRFFIEFFFEFRLQWGRRGLGWRRQLGGLVK